MGMGKSGHVGRKIAATLGLDRHAVVLSSTRPRPRTATWDVTHGERRARDLELRASRTS